jgi:hypothetical protein
VSKGAFSISEDMNTIIFEIGRAGASLPSAGIFCDRRPVELEPKWIYIGESPCK